MFDWLFGFDVWLPVKNQVQPVGTVPLSVTEFGLGLAVIRPQLILPFPRIGLKNQITTAT